MSEEGKEKGGRQKSGSINVEGRARSLVKDQQ